MSSKRVSGSLAPFEEVVTTVDNEDETIRHSSQVTEPKALNNDVLSLAMSRDGLLQYEE